MLAKSKYYWFKAKDYGWGWYPSSWQGWLVLVGFITGVVCNFVRLDAKLYSVNEVLTNFIPQTMLLTLVLIAICWKTGEKPEWRWGEKKL